MEYIESSELELLYYLWNILYLIITISLSPPGRENRKSCYKQFFWTGPGGGVFGGVFLLISRVVSYGE